MAEGNNNAELSISKKDVQDILSSMMKEQERLAKDNSDNSTEKGLFGLISLSPQMNSLVNVIYDIIQPRIREGVEKPIRKYGSDVLYKLGVESAKANKWARIAADTFGWGYVAAKPLWGAYDTIGDTFEARHKLVERMTPILNAEGLSPSSSALNKTLENNEILAVERERISADMWHSAKKNVGAASFAVIPQIMIKRLDDKKFAKELEQGGGYDRRSSVTERIEQKYKQQQEYRQKFDELERQKLAKRYGDDTTAEEIFRKKDTEGILDRDFERWYKEVTAVEVEDSKKRTFLSEDNLKDFGPLIGSSVAEMVAKGLDNTREKDNPLKVTALDKIEKIYNKTHDSKRISQVDGKDLKTFIKDIFQTHQKNMRQRKIGARWDEELDYACEKIAEAIEKGKMHPMALVHIVGERMVVKKGGRSVVSRSEADAVVENMTAKMPAKFSVDAEHYLSETVMDEQEIKQTLSELQGSARDFFASLLPDEVLKHFGYNEQDIYHLHERMKTQFATILSSVVLDLASMPVEELKKAKLTDSEINLITELGAKVKAGDISSVVAAISTHGEFKKGIEWPIVNFSTYWKEVARGQRKIGSEFAKNNNMLRTEIEEKERAEAEEKETQQSADSEENNKDTGLEFDVSHRAKRAVDDVKKAADESVDDMPGKIISDATHKGIGKEHIGAAIH